MIHYYIYTLSNSTTNEPFYVGRSKDPDARYRKHKYNSRNPKSKEYEYELYAAIRELYAAGQDFVMNIIEEGVWDLKAAKQRENHHIAQYTHNFDLINKRNRGATLDGHDEGTKCKMSKPKEQSKNIAAANRARGKAVLQFSMDGAFITEYQIISDAARTVGCYRSSISACCHGKRPSTGGYKWKFVSEYNEDTKHEFLKIGKVQVITTTNERAA